MAHKVDTGENGLKTGMQLRSLIVEDSEGDALLLVRELKRAGYEAIFRRVETDVEMRQALERETWDIIIADYKMPLFSGLAALELFKEMELDIPFIVVSGAIGESAAVDAMLAGAHDYVMKQNFSRLVPAIRRELSEAELRKERRRAEEAMRKQRDEITDLYNNAPCGYHSLSADGAIVRMNDTELAWLGFTRDEIIGKKKFADLLTPQSQKIFYETFCHFRENGGVSNLEFDLVRKDRTILPVLLNASAVRGDDGTFVMSRSMVFDMTKQKEAERDRQAMEVRFSQSQKMEAIGTLAGGIAHDFNNILTVLSGYGALLQMSIDKSDPMQIYIDQILSASRKAATLTQGLLTFSRQQQISFFPISVNGLIEEAEKLLRRLLTEDIGMEAILSEEDMTVMADKTQIDQILFNLVANARDAMQNGGTLTIETRRTRVDGKFAGLDGRKKAKAYAVISVTDTGTGIDEATKAKMFDPFFTTKEIGKGTGLGLSTVYGIVKQHNGFIDVSSRTGAGTTIEVYLPVTLTKVTEEKTAIPEIRTGKETVLLAEDDEQVMQFFGEMLRRYGYTVIEAVDGEEAIDKFRCHADIELLILDTVMPKKNGKEVFEEILRDVPRVKALFMSGYTADVILDKGIVDGEVEFISKPVSASELLLKVREMLDRDV